MAALDPVSRLGLAIALILAAAKLGGHLAARLKLPAVLGELVAGILLGSVPVPFFESLRTDVHVDMLGRLGVLILLFQVGLDSTVKDVLRVGLASAAVAVLGTVGTLVLGFGAASLVLPHSTILLRLFLAGALTATSIGISARVLKDAGAGRRPEALTILGASVIDDVLGLVVLAILSGAVSRASAGQEASAPNVVWLVAKTVLFLAGALLVGTKLSPALFRLTARLRVDGALLATGLAFCFVLAWAADAIGLAPIVGAFTAGLILDDSHSARFVARGEPSLADRMEPISTWLVPIFFVLIGMRADFAALAHPRTLLLTGALAVGAVGGKLACAAGAQRGSDRIAIALGMLPRGEVSLVFASLGLSLGLLDAGQYSALVAVVVLTTLATPVLLRWRLAHAALVRPGEG
ncbi:MAG TPA: cation:proton antiporter [Polyangiaceae bacterium]|jgi:Kef-type K+ transport system membrane component KefB